MMHALSFSLSLSLGLQVLQGAQLIAVASSDPAAAGVDGSPLQGSDIQVQYVQLAPVTDHSAANPVRRPFLFMNREWAEGSHIFHDTRPSTLRSSPKRLHSFC